MKEKEWERPLAKWGNGSQDTNGIVEGTEYSVQSTGGTPEPGNPGLCLPVNDGPGTVQPGKHTDSTVSRIRELAAFIDDSNLGSIKELYK